MGDKVEVFYTGGGIWLSEVDLADNTYAVVSSQFSDCLSVYNKVDNEDEKYMLEDMILCENVGKLSGKYKEVYDLLLNKLSEKRMN